MKTRVVLATVLVGNDPASEVYVRNKRKTAEALGFKSVHVELPAGGRFGRGRVIETEGSLVSLGNAVSLGGGMKITPDALKLRHAREGELERGRARQRAQEVDPGSLQDGFQQLEVPLEVVHKEHVKRLRA